MTSVTLNLFPSRVEIGQWTDPATQKPVKVYMSTPFERALRDLFIRVGGPIADSNSDLSVISATQDAPPDYGSVLRQVAQLQQEFALQQSLVAENSALRGRLADVERMLAEVPAVIGELRKRVADLERSTISVPPLTDWEHPGNIGAKTAKTGTFTALTYSGQLTSTVATGTAPMVVTSTTKVANLNVDLLDGNDWAVPAAIGTTTPNTAAFTALTATGNIDLGIDSAARTMFVRGNASGVGGGVFTAWRNNNANVIAIGNKSAIFVSAYDARPYIYSAANYIEFSAGFMTNGDVGFFGTTPVAKQTVTGSRGGNAALASVLTALANYGIITNSSTA